jgi:hypothetical protein
MLAMIFRRRGIFSLSQGHARRVKGRAAEKRWKSGSELLEFGDVQLYFDELFQSFGNFLRFG